MPDLRQPVIASAASLRHVAATVLLSTLAASGCHVPETHLSASRLGNSDASMGADAQYICTGSTFDLTMPQANVVLLAERSAYMNTQPSSKLCAGCATLWDALLYATIELTFDSAAYFRWGLKLFPSSDAGTNACYTSAGMDVSPEFLTEDPVLSALENTTAEGQAPAAAAFQQAVAFTRARGDALPTVYLLVLGGDPTCGTSNSAQSDYSTLITEIEQTSAIVFVLGIGPTRLGWDQVAAAGGTGPSYRMSELATLLTDISAFGATTPTCTYPMPPVPAGGQPISVLLDAMTVPQSSSNGYTLSSDQQKLKLNGSYCAGVRSYSTLTIQIGCQ